MNKIKKVIVDSVFPHVSPTGEKDGKLVHEVKIEDIMDSLYVNLNVLLKEAYEEGTYAQEVDWEEAYEEWVGVGNPGGLL